MITVEVTDATGLTRIDPSVERTNRMVRVFKALQASGRNGAIRMMRGLAVRLTFHADTRGASATRSPEGGTGIVQCAVTYMPISGEVSGDQGDLLLIAMMVIAAALLIKAKLKNPPAP